LFFAGAPPLVIFQLLGHWVLGMKELTLKSSLATSLASGHPWVYRDHVGNFSAPSGTWVKLNCGSFSAVGLWDEESQIAIRIFSSRGPVDSQWIRARVEEAWELRAPLREKGVTGYRLIFGEADQLPGIVVDVYGEFAVLVSYSKSLGGLLFDVAQAVFEIGKFRGVVRRSKKDGQVDLRVLQGEPPPPIVEIQEYGMKLLARLTRGQKTGLFFDHRENRETVRRLSNARSVLNLFSYTGGFSVAGALGGARAVTSVDIAAPAVADSEENFRLNGLERIPHEALAMDVFRFLEEAAREGRRFDLVVCDPPSFARNKTQLHAAEKAYRKLMSQGLALVSEGGLFCAASCTSQVGPEAFRLALMDAGRKARKRLTILHDVGHAPDHPVNVAHEEGRYLKFLVARVQERC
jgi:23S rRNA (cytosine1962-C5)-methyltransferase